jgi:O-antigen/teichoic acid export membrane protein
MGSTVLNFFSSEIDILIVGRMLGAESLGLYSLSKQIVMKLYTIVNPIVISVLNPVLASIQKEKEKVKNYYLRVVYLLASINFPIYFLIVILSKEILAILYGNNYVMGYAILSFLAIAFCTNTIGNPVGSLYIATGRTDIGFKWTIFRVAITPVIIFFASRINVNAVAIAMAGITIILIVPAWWVQLKPMANIQLKEYLSQFYKPYLLLLLLSGIYLVGSQFFQLSFGIIPNVLVKGSVAFIIFLSILLIVDKKRFIDIITIIKSRHE